MTIHANEGQSFVHHAIQLDGRKFTQIALTGRITNTSDKRIFPTDIRLISPRGFPLESRHILTEHENGRVFGSDNAIAPNDRANFSGHVFAHGLIGEKGKTLTVVVSISDQFGHWHKVAFQNLRND